MATQGCNFREAIHYLADLAGVQIKGGRDDTCLLKAMQRRQHRERVNVAADKLATVERSLRLECRDKIQECDRILAKPGPWDRAQWQRAKWAQVLQRDFLSPEYTLVAFGSMAERVRYVLANDGERANICGAIRIAGGVRTDGGYFMEGMG